MGVAEIEKLTALAIQLRARLDSVEEQLAASAAARTKTAGRIENLVAESTRLQRLEQTLSEVRSESARGLAELERKLTGDLKRAADRSVQAETNRRGELTLLETRLAELDGRIAREELPERVATVARETARVEARLDGLEDAHKRLENRPPRTDPAVTARLDALAGAISELRGDFAIWQKRLEEQRTVVQEARAIAERMAGIVASVERTHHATTESQRLAEERLLKLLAEVREEISARWSRFDQARAHDWDRLSVTNATRDHALAELQASVAALRDGFEASIGRLESDIHGVAAERQTALARLVEGVAAVEGAFSAFRQTVESGLPNDLRTESGESRRLADRRAFRARRPTATE